LKAVILAGGFGTRISEESAVRPKPMVEIGDQPILWHIMKIFSHYGITDFIICLGYKGYVIKEYFADYFLHRSDIRFDLKNNKIEFLQNDVEPWNVTLVDTGEGTMTGGRIKRVRKYIGDSSFCMTYGDGVCNVNVNELITFHKKQNTLATVTAVQPEGRFGVFTLEEEQSKIFHFREKPKGDGAWINGGYFVLEPQVIDYIADDSTVWEQDPLKQLASEGQLSAYKHEDFWFAMDTLRDRNLLEKMWRSGNPPWKVWKE
jgi:glucose-1-phosphate cytidylyltransferase